MARKVGAPRLFWISGAAIIPMAGLWIFADLFSGWSLPLPFSVGGKPYAINGMMVYLCGVQLTSGITWGAYELAMTLMFLEAIPRDERTTVLTYYNFGNSAAMMLGGVIGGTLLWTLGEGQLAELVIFGLSSVCRLGVMLGCSRLQVEPPAEKPQLRLVLPEGDVIEPVLSRSRSPAPGIAMPVPIAVTAAPR